MIKAINFDLDGVYFINGKENFIANLVKLGISEEEARRVFLKSDEMNLLYKCGKWTDEEYWNWALKEWNLNLSVKEIVNLLISDYEVNQQVIDVVKSVRANGYKTLICSNNFPARVNGLHKRFGFLDNFDYAVFSFECGFSKPDKRIFETLISQSQLSGEEIVYSDDDETKFQTALDLGINCFLYTDFPSFVEKLKSLGVNL